MACDAVHRVAAKVILLSWGSWQIPTSKTLLQKHTHGMMFFDDPIRLSSQDRVGCEKYEVLKVGTHYYWEKYVDAG